MGCAICGQVKPDEELLTFSHNAYSQIISILKINNCQATNKTAGSPDSAIHICRECLQDSYQYLNG